MSHPRNRYKWVSKAIEEACVLLIRDRSLRVASVGDFSRVLGSGVSLGEDAGKTDEQGLSLTSDISTHPDHCQLLMTRRVRLYGERSIQHARSLVNLNLGDIAGSNPSLHQTSGWKPPAAVLTLTHECSCWDTHMFHDGLVHCRAMD